MTIITTVVIIIYNLISVIEEYSYLNPQVSLYSDPLPTHPSGFRELLSCPGVTLTAGLSLQGDSSS